MNQYVRTSDSPSFANVTVSSDERLKTDVKTIEGALNKVIRARGVTFTRIADGIPDVGVIAQEMLEILPEAVTLRNDGYYTVAYGNIVGLLIEAIKTLEQRVYTLEHKDDL